MNIEANILLLRHKDKYYNILTAILFIELLNIEQYPSSGQDARSTPDYGHLTLQDTRDSREMATLTKPMKDQYLASHGAGWKNIDDRGFFAAEDLWWGAEIGLATITLGVEGN